MHETMEKFGYPHTLLKEWNYWCVLLRPAQITLGSLVLVLKDSGPRSFSEVSAAAFAEFPNVCSDIESTVKDLFGAKKFNYLALMMVDPHVHFHVLPRYSAPVQFHDEVFTDINWPGPPQITEVLNISDQTFSAILKGLKGKLTR